MVKKIINFSAALALSLSAAALNVQATEIETNTAKLQAMNKLTGRVSVIDVPVNGEAQFGSFSIVVRACKTRPPEEAPDNFAFVDVVDKQEDGTVSNIFKGWMISSSPALNAIEHPIYDVWLLQCVDSEVDKTKLLTPEQLAARDEIIPVADTSSEAANKEETVPAKDASAEQNNDEPENILPAEASAPLSTEANTSQPNPPTQPIELPADNAEIQVKSIQEDLPLKIEENVYETDDVYIPDEMQQDGPQNLIPDVETPAPAPLLDTQAEPQNMPVVVPEVQAAPIPQDISNQLQKAINSEVVEPVEPVANVSVEEASDIVPQQLISFEDSEEPSLPSFLQQ